MIQEVRCYKCGDEAVRLLLMGKEIMQANCTSCETDLLEEVDTFREKVEQGELEDEDTADVAEA